MDGISISYTATFGSGSRIVITIVTQELPQTVRLGRPESAVFAFSAEAPGTTHPVNFARPTAIGMPPMSSVRIVVFGLQGVSKSALRHSGPLTLAIK
jgi:hypothetical protein